jgi:predicted restriction endonuclease
MGTITINGEEFDRLDKIENITVADSFVLSNKTGTGHGEARLYVGQQNQVSRFFSSLPAKGFFLKEDFEYYMSDAETEYKNPRQKYNSDIGGDWKKYVNELGRLTGKISFNLKTQLGQQDKNRFYVSSEDYIYEFMRKIALPQISYITILKLESKSGKIFYYFRLFLDNNYTSASQPLLIKKEEEKIEKDTTITVTERTHLTKSRIGQGIFRTKLLEECHACPVTSISDDRILIASHIKPWSVSDNKERLDPKNGLLLTPTFDKLFNDGFISFDDDGTMIISSSLSYFTMDNLGLAENKKYSVPTKGREKYLKYHRENIFRK